MNYDRVATLLPVLEGTRNLPKLKAIYDAATAELEAIAQGLEKKAEPMAEPVVEDELEIQPGPEVQPLDEQPTLRR